MSVPANAHLSVEQEQIAFNNTNPLEADFEAKCKGVALHTTAAVRISFDRPANSGDFLMPANTTLNLDHNIEFTKMSALGNAGSGTLYILARR